MLDPASDPGHRRSLLLPAGGGGPPSPPELSVSQGSEMDVVTTRRVMRPVHHTNAAEKSSAFPWLQPIFYIVGSASVLTLTIVVSIFVIALMPLVREARVVSSGMAEMMPRINVLVAQGESVINNQTQEVAGRALNALEDFSVGVKTLRGKLEDPVFIDNVGALFEMFVKQDIRDALQRLGQMLGSVEMLANSVRTNGMQAQLTIPLAPVATVPAVGTT